MRPKPTFTHFPELETETLLLQELQPGHAADILNHFSALAVTRYLDVKGLETLGEAEELITLLARRFQHERSIRWGVSQKGCRRIIGTCGYNTWSKRKFQAELGYDLSPAYWRRGIMTEAVQAVIRFGFTKMDLQKIEALVLPENVASEAFLESLGFDWEARVREFQVSTGQFAHMTVFALKKHQWLTRLINPFDFWDGSK